VPDDITIAMVTEELDSPEAGAGAILDGFPRTVGQAAALDAVLADRGERIGQAVFIDVPADELVERVSGRWVCPECGTPYHLQSDPPARPGLCDKDGAALQQRDDDRPEVVRARLEKQVPPMLEVVNHYRREGVLTRVDGDRTIGEVAREILELVS
jgi:adenylate kinase